MSAPIVDVHELRKVYRSYSLTGRRHIEAVRGVSLQAFPGEVFGLLGPNGAGKTTLIKMLLGVVKPSGGNATLFGQAIGSAAARRRVGYLPESLRVDRHHSARSALRYYGRMSGMASSEIRQRSDQLLRLVGLEGRDRESVRRFSKGMYQRLGLAQALLHDPDLLVLDEPTDGLDPVGRNEVRKVIDRLRDDGKTIFLNSHILQEVELVCTRVAILDKGEIKAIGPIKQLADLDQKHLTVELPIDSVSPVDASPAEAESPAEGGPASTSPGAAPVPFGTLFAERIDRVVKTTIDDGVQRISIPVNDQSEIDWIVDKLREAGQSIIKLEVQRESLEETFMRLVGSQEKVS